LLIAEKSITYGKCPEVPKVVRCDCGYQIRVFQPSVPGKDDSPCTVTCMNLTDIKGWVSPGMVNAANADITAEEIENIDIVASKIIPGATAPRPISLMIFDKKKTHLEENPHSPRNKKSNDDEPPTKTVKKLSGETD